MNWTDIIKFLISVSGLSVVLIYIGKQLINKTLDAGMEKYKSALGRADMEHGLRYSKLHEQRAEKIRLLYTLIYELEKKLRAFTDIMQGPDWSDDGSRSEVVKTCLADLKEALELNRIYFSDELWQKIESILRKSTSALATMNRAKLIDKGILGKGNEDPTKTWLAADVYVQNEIYQTRLDLVNEFHQIIGVQ